MSFFKDLYIEEVERLASLYEEAGLAPDKAYDMASEAAYDSARERLADMADFQKKYERGE